MKRIAIIGGGISGLSAALTLEVRRRAGEALAYVVFEASPRLGGVLRSEEVDGCLVEAGPDSFLTEKPWAADLCRQVGLGSQLLGSNDGLRRTYILLKGRLLPMPDGLMFLVPTKMWPVAFSSLFSFGTKLRMAREWFRRPRASGEDESVASLVERHYGTEMVDRLADPLLSGVYGGEAAHLSVRAVLPRFAAMEAEHGSLGRGMLAARKALAGKASHPIFTTLKGGMQQLVNAVVARLDPAALRTGTPVQGLKKESSGWSVRVGDSWQAFDAVILAVPAPAAAMLLRETDAELANELGSIAYSSSVTVALGYDKGVRDRLPRGFGFLVPRSENKRLLAATFVHNKFSHRVVDDRALLRCFLGGSRDEAALAMSDEQIVLTVMKELREVLSIAVRPLFTRVYRWTSSMAQYDVGHLEKLERMERLRQRLPGLALAGNGLRGIGVPDCVRSGREVAEQVTKALQP